MKEWLDNEQLFVEQLRAGHEQAERVADSIRHYGIDVVVTPMEVRQHVSQRRRFRNEFDLLVDRRHRVEVKSRDLSFTGPHDYPYETANVYSLRGWRSKDQKPKAIILISQRTGGLAVIPCSTEPNWTVEWSADHIREIDRYQILRIDRLYLRSLDDFIEWVERRAA